MKPLVWVECLVERHSRSRTEYLVKARTQFKERSSATNVEIVLPLPPDAITPTVRTTMVREGCADVGHRAASAVMRSPRCSAGLRYPAMFRCIRVAHVCSLCMQGKCTYAPELSAMVWKIPNFGGGKEHTLRCKFGLPSVAAEDEGQGRMPPIKVKFEIPYYTVSGIQVRYLKVNEKSGYQALPWVRYITSGGEQALLHTHRPITFLQCWSRLGQVTQPAMRFVRRWQL